MRSAILLAAWLCLLPLGIRSSAAEPVARPNIVLIFIDDMGYGDIGPFGNTKLKTPQLDQFAAEGMKFTSFYATPVCSMSRACLLTGCYNARLSIPGVLFREVRLVYNLATDPGESTDVAAECPEIVVKLQVEAARREAEIKEQRRPAGQLSSAK